MFIADCLGANEQNHLTIGGIDTLELAAEYGTPLYAFDEDAIRKHCRMYTESVRRFYNGNGLVLYASKACCTTALCKLIAEEGMGLDVVSGGELYTAKHAGFPMEHVYFHGNNKTPDELKFALQCNIGQIVVDNRDELLLINKLWGAAGKKANILFRIKPGIDAHTHDFIMTGQIDSKFGVALETGEAMDIIKEAAALPHVQVVGVHCHVGSQIFDLEPFREAAEVMVNFMADVQDEVGLTLSKLNLGGGFGIQYVKTDDPVPYDKYMEAVSQVVKETAKKRNLPLPYILMEPGRSIVASAGITLYTVGNIKEIPGVRSYLSVDGGMGDNPRYILYQADYDFEIADRCTDEKTSVYTIAGKCCESGDLLGEHIPLQPAKRGDTLAVLATGAYNYSMASNYNRIPRPAMVMVKDGASRLVVKRETYEDIIKNDL